jgi:hypothetical protein
MLESLIADIGVSVMSSLLEDEAETKAGAKHAKRDGYDDGSVVIAGQKRAILKPRLRAGGKEVPLVRYGLFQSPRRMRSAVNHMRCKEIDRPTTNERRHRFRGIL